MWFCIEVIFFNFIFDTVFKTLQCSSLSNSFGLISIYFFTICLFVYSEKKVDDNDLSFIIFTKGLVWSSAGYCTKNFYVYYRDFFKLSSVKKVSSFDLGVAFS